MNTILDLGTLAGMTERTLVRNGDRQAVTLRREYDVAAADLWEAWTDRARLARWLGEVRGDVAVGATFELCMQPPDSDIATLTLLACEAPRRLTVQWEWPGEVDSYVDLHIEPIGAERSRLTLEHVALASSTSLSYGPGWEEFLVRLGLGLEGQDPKALAFADLEPTVRPMWQAVSDAGSVEVRWPLIVDTADAATLTAGRLLPHPVAEVWRSLTSPAAIGSWFGEFAGDPSVGGAFTVTFDGGSASGTVRECDPNRSFEVSWTWSHQDFESRVRVDLIADDAGTGSPGTLVTIRQSGVVGPALGYTAGWAAYLASAARHLAGITRSEAEWHADWTMAQAMIRRTTAG